VGEAARKGLEEIHASLIDGQPRFAAPRAFETPKTPQKAPEAPEKVSGEPLFSFQKGDESTEQQQPVPEKTDARAAHTQATDLKTHKRADKTQLEHSKLFNERHKLRLEQKSTQERQDALSALQAEIEPSKSVSESEKSAFDSHSALFARKEKEMSAKERELEMESGKKAFSEERNALERGNIPYTRPQTLEKAF